MTRPSTSLLRVECSAVAESRRPAIVRERDQDFIGHLELSMSAELECHRRGKQMAMLHPVRKACPACGKPMKAVPDEASEKCPRYVCTTCNDCPLRDPNVLKWAHSPLRPPEA